MPWDTLAAVAICGLIILLVDEVKIRRMKRIADQFSETCEQHKKATHEAFDRIDAAKRSFAEEVAKAERILRIGAPHQ